MEPEAEPMEPEETPVPGAKPAPKAAPKPAPKAARIKATFDTPAAATGEIAELSEMSKLVAASPAVSQLLSDENLVATIFAPNNDVSWLRRTD